MLKVSKKQYWRVWNDRIISSGTTTSLVAKNRTEKLSQLFEDGFWFSNCLNDCMKVPDMIGSFATSATASLLAINETSRRGMECPKLLGSEYNKKLPWCWGNVKGERVFQKLILSCVIKIFGCCSKLRGGLGIDMDQHTFSHTHTHTHTNKHTHTHTGIERHKDTERHRDTLKETHTDKHTHRQIQRDNHRKREREREL